MPIEDNDFDKTTLQQEAPIDSQSPDPFIIDTSERARFMISDNNEAFANEVKDYPATPIYSETAEAPSVEKPVSQSPSKLRIMGRRVAAIATAAGVIGGGVVIAHTVESSSEAASSVVEAEQPQFVGETTTFIQPGDSWYSVAENIPGSEYMGLDQIVIDLRELNPDVSQLVPGVEITIPESIQE